MKLKSCIVFAVSIFEESKLHVLRDYLDTFKQNYSDCDIYIGVNHGSVESVEDVINSYQLNSFTVRNNETTYNTSDASAYQVALKYLKNSGKRYDLYWFAHTKGGVNERSHERSLYLQYLFNDRNNIETMFAAHRFLGSYALRGVSTSAAGDLWPTYNGDYIIPICDNAITSKLLCTHVNWSYIETMYVINRHSIDTFFDITPDDFFNTMIPNRYYFEVIFPWIPSRCGYFPYVKQEGCYFNNSISLKSITNSWIIENNLLYLQSYLSL